MRETEGRDKIPRGYSQLKEHIRHLHFAGSTAPPFGQTRTREGGFFLGAHSPHLLGGHEIEAAVDAPPLFRCDGCDAAACPRSGAVAEHSYVAVEVGGPAAAIDCDTGRVGKYGL